MSQAPAMPVFVDALIGDTTHLTAEEMGAYCLLLFVTWRNNGQPLPDDDNRLARVCRLTPAKWKKVRPVLVEFFDLSGGMWRQKRLEKEWSFTQQKIEKNRENGKRGGRPKSLNESDAGKADGSVSLNPNDKRNESTHTHTQDSSLRSESGGGVAPERDSRSDETSGGTVPQATAPDATTGTDPAEQLVSLFEDLRRELWPTESAFPAPRLTLLTEARGYLAQGAPFALAAEVIERGMRDGAARGKSATMSLRAFHRSVADAIANHKSAREKTHVETQQAEGQHHATADDLIRDRQARRARSAVGGGAGANADPVLPAVPG